MATTFPLPSSEPTRLAAIWLHPPEPRQVNDDQSSLEKAVLVVHFLQLVGSTRTKPIPLGLRYAGIVQLAFEPKLRGQFPLAAGLDGDVEPPGGVFCHQIRFQGVLLRDAGSVVVRNDANFGIGTLGHTTIQRPRHRQAKGITPSLRIISTSMPSRRPRSATRRRGNGNARRMASRIAQPANTRSARSVPMHGFCARSR